MNEQHLRFKKTLYLEKPVPILGTAVCDFQAQPLIEGRDISSDWEYEVVKAKQNGPSGIKGSVDNLPRFYDNYREILKLVPQLNNNTFRYSLDFGRLCPYENWFDSQLMNHYLRVLAEIHKVGASPLLTIHHWPMPKAFCQYDSNSKVIKGAWEHPHIMQHFVYYLENIFEYLFNPDKIRNALVGHYDNNLIDKIIEQGICRMFITINEPAVITWLSYIWDAFIPYKRFKFLTYETVKKRVIEAHRICYDMIKEKAPYDILVGVGHAMTYAQAKTPFSHFLKMRDISMQWDLIDSFEKNGSDFLGVQYYFRHIIGLKGIMPGTGPICDHPGFGDIYPRGIYYILKKAQKIYSKKPIIITEFGFCDHSDMRKPWWMIETLHQFTRAIRKKEINLYGILLWSLFDNLEWNMGMDALFGIFDRNGEPHKSDDGNNISSRQVWTQFCDYAQKPSEDKRIKLLELYNLAREQANQYETFITNF